MTELDFSHVFSLNLVNSEANHKVGYNLGFLVGLTDNLNRLVDIEQDFLEALQEVELVLLFVQIVEHTAANTLDTEAYPFLKKLFYAENHRGSADKHIEVARIAVLKRCEPEELFHKLVRVDAALQINCDFETVKSCFVTDI